ncbi:hypothetical protein ABPG74_019866 [Tetrahymena malaccensis]
MEYNVLKQQNQNLNKLLFDEFNSNTNLIALQSLQNEIYQSQSIVNCLQIINSQFNSFSPKDIPQAKSSTSFSCILYSIPLDQNTAEHLSKRLYSIEEIRKQLEQVRQSYNYYEDMESIKQQMQKDLQTKFEVSKVVEQLVDNIDISSNQINQEQIEEVDN